MNRPNFGLPTDALKVHQQHEFGSLTMEPAVNHSIYTVDKTTHLKVVVLVLVGSIAMMAITLTARLARPEVSAQATATRTVYKPHPDHTLTVLTRPEKHPI
ncbi:hypothetical protein ACNJX9_21785 [Bradyrhizobium sp. DASA03076]|uniref:Uncharacterized protein n=1 Tax=Bradyrhizobium manausense TaxID=989370 RepID=A0A0R3D730_9BRAD|nr:hypothetical protein AOQ71_30975 [Bradyrhizobium manausense]